MNLGTVANLSREIPFFEMTVPVNYSHSSVTLSLDGAPSSFNKTATATGSVAERMAPKVMLKLKLHPYGKM